MKPVELLIAEFISFDLRKQEPESRLDLIGLLLEFLVALLMVQRAAFDDFSDYRF